MGMFRKNKQDFYQLLEKQSEITSMGIKALAEYLNQKSASAQQVIDLEKDADEARLILIDELNKTFVTPVDREDIFNLSRAIDDVMDYALSTVEEMSLFNVRPNLFLVKMAEILFNGIDQIHQSILRLKKNTMVAYQHALEAKKSENDIEHIYRQALVELFQGKDLVTMLKHREIYRHLSNAADRCDEAANVICNIIVKNT